MPYSLVAAGNANCCILVDEDTLKVYLRKRNYCTIVKITSYGIVAFGFAWNFWTSGRRCQG